MLNFSVSCSTKSSSKVSSFVSSKFSSKALQEFSVCSVSLAVVSRLNIADFVRYRGHVMLSSVNPLVRAEHVLIKGREFVFRRIFPLVETGVINSFFDPDGRSN